MINWGKNYLKKFPALYQNISYLVHYREHFWEPDKIKNLQDVLKIFSANVKDISFIQIGSNDGISGDPLHDYIVSNRWKGILIEPVPFLFQELLTNYSGCDYLEFRNCAVGKMTGIIELYAIDDNKRDVLPPWYFQLASFEKKMLYRHGIPNVDDLIKNYLVQVDTFDRIVKSSALKYLNLVHIDTEGYDYEILKTIDFNHYHPEIIIFEHRHLVIEDKKEAVKLLKKSHYKLFLADYDILAISDKFYFEEIKMNL